MKSQSQLDAKIKNVKAHIEDLQRQREENAQKGNWAIVRTIKDTISIAQITLKELEWVSFEDTE
jgi:hypothetical protein